MASRNFQGYHRITIDAPVLDSIIFCLLKTTSRVKYLGLRDEADSHFVKYFPDAPYEKYSERNFLESHKYPKLLGIIDCEENYEYRRV